MAIQLHLKKVGNYIRVTNVAGSKRTYLDKAIFKGAFSVDGSGDPVVVNISTKNPAFKDWANLPIADLSIQGVASGMDGFDTADHLEDAIGELSIDETDSQGADSGGVSPVAVSYADLTDLIDQGTLVPGKKYLITDFKSKGVIPNTEGLLDVLEVFGQGPDYPLDTPYSSPDDFYPIVVTAVGTSSLLRLAYSPDYPQDIVYYCHSNFGDPSAHINAPDGCDKGFIYRMIDTGHNIDLPCDWRFSLVIRFAPADQPLWVVGDTYAKGDSVKDAGGTIFFSTISGNIGNDPNADGDRWFNTHMNLEDGVGYLLKPDGNDLGAGFTIDGNPEVYTINAPINVGQTDNVYIGRYDTNSTPNICLRGFVSNVRIESGVDITLPLSRNLAYAKMGRVRNLFFFAQSTEQFQAESLDGFMCVGDACINTIFIGQCGAIALGENCASNIFYNCLGNTLGVGCAGNVFKAGVNGMMLPSGVIKNEFPGGYQNLNFVGYDPSSAAFYPFFKQWVFDSAGVPKVLAMSALNVLTLYDIDEAIPYTG